MKLYFFQWWLGFLGSTLDVWTFSCWINSRYRVFYQNFSNFNLNTIQYLNWTYFLGIVGLGRIGQTVQKMLQPFGVQKFVYTGRHKLSEDLENGAEYKSFEDLLKMSDFVIVTCALTPDTKEIFNKNAFEIMKPASVFINTSRGGKNFTKSVIVLKVVLLTFCWIKFAKSHCWMK